MVNKRTTLYSCSEQTSIAHKDQWAQGTLDILDQTPDLKISRHNRGTVIPGLLPCFWEVQRTPTKTTRTKGEHAKFHMGLKDK